MDRDGDSQEPTVHRLPGKLDCPVVTTRRRPQHPGHKQSLTTGVSIRAEQQGTSHLTYVDGRWKNLGQELCIEPSRAAYSTLVEIDEHRIGVLYDRGTLASDCTRISFRTFFVDAYR